MRTNKDTLKLALEEAKRDLAWAEDRLKSHIANGATPLAIIEKENIVAGYKARVERIRADVYGLRKICKKVSLQKVSAKSGIRGKNGHIYFNTPSYIVIGNTIDLFSVDPDTIEALAVKLFEEGYIVKQVNFCSIVGGIPTPGCIEVEYTIF